MQIFIGQILILGFLLLVILRLSARLERRLEAQRIIHRLFRPLSHYAGLLDHELQNSNYHPDPLISQAVLDHSTELRSFLIRPESHDLFFFKPAPWVKSLNSILIRLEDALEASIAGGWDDKHEVVKNEVRRMLDEMNQYPQLKYYCNEKEGLVEP